MADLGITDVDFEEKDVPEELRKLEESGVSGSSVPTVDEALGDSSASSSPKYFMSRVLFSHQGKGVIRQF